jgi:hypothetical protein
MSFTIDARWLFILPLGLVLVFVSWVFWNISKEIWAQKRRRVRTLRGARAKIHPAETKSRGRSGLNQAP